MNRTHSPAKATPAPPPAVDAGMPRMALRKAEVVASLGISSRSFEREVCAGRFPRPDLKIGKTPLWKPSTVQAWIDRGGNAS